MDNRAFWTPETDGRARRLWLHGRTAQAIAEAIGAPSRAAVLGRMWRLGLARRPRTPQPADLAGFPSASRAAMRWQRPRMVPAPEARSVEVPCTPRPWLSRGPRECAFPVEGDGKDVLSCCNPCGREPYCEGHRAAMFVAEESDLTTGSEYVAIRKLENSVRAARSARG